VTFLLSLAAVSGEPGAPASRGGSPFTEATTMLAGTAPAPAAGGFFSAAVRMGCCE
jgi:hypothetical protein